MSTADYRIGDHAGVWSVMIYVNGRYVHTYGRYRTEIEARRVVRRRPLRATTKAAHATRLPNARPHSFGSSSMTGVTRTGKCRALAYP